MVNDTSCRRSHNKRIGITSAPNDAVASSNGDRGAPPTTTRPSFPSFMGELSSALNTGDRASRMILWHFMTCRAVSGEGSQGRWGGGRQDETRRGKAGGRSSGLTQPCDHLVHPQWCTWHTCTPHHAHAPHQQQQRRTWCTWNHSLWRLPPTTPVIKTYPDLALPYVPSSIVLEDCGGLHPPAQPSQAPHPKALQAPPAPTHLVFHHKLAVGALP